MKATVTDGGAEIQNPIPKIGDYKTRYIPAHEIKGQKEQLKAKEGASRDKLTGAIDINDMELVWTYPPGTTLNLEAIEEPKLEYYTQSRYVGGVIAYRQSLKAYQTDIEKEIKYRVI